MKMNLKIANWPFKEITNSLEVIMSTKAGEGENGCLEPSQGPTLTWNKLTKDGVSLYL
jgi:hypothetical protein